jgi:hypothetical protein
MATYTLADEKARKQAAGIPLNSGVATKTATPTATSTGGMTQAQQLTEVRRKATEGIALANPNANNQALYDAQRASQDKEIARKVGTGEALTGKSAYNQSMYDRLLAEKNKGEVVAQSIPTDQPQSTGFDLKSIYDNMYSSQAQKLKDARDQALSGLAGQEDVIGQNRILALNNNDVTASQQLKALREQNADMGVNGGDAISAQLANQTAQGQNASGIETNSGNQLKQLFAQRDQIKNSANADDLALLQGIQSQQGLAQQSQYNTDRGYGLDLAQLSGRLPGNGGQTLAGQQFDYSKLTDQRNYDYGVGRDKVSDSQWQQQQDLSKQLSERDFNYQVGRDDVADSQFAQQFAESVKQNGIQNALARVRASSSGSGGTKDLSLAQKISIWKISGEAPDGIPGITPGTKVYDEVAARKAAEKSGGVKLWDAIKGVISSVAKGAGSASGASDADISNYLK